MQVVVHQLANIAEGRLPAIDGLPELEALADGSDEENNGDDWTFSARFLTKPC